MKKLLLVALVPILVLGFVGCGKVFDNGDPLPDALLGPWVNSTDEYTITFAGNHASVVFIPTGQYTPEGMDQPNADNPRKVTLSFRVGFGGGGPNPTKLDTSSTSRATAFTIEFYDFNEKKNNLRGTILGWFVGDDIKIENSQAESQFYLVPPVGTYERP